MAPKSVFIVEDDPDIRTNLVEVIGSEGYPVQDAVNGQSALDQLSTLAEEQRPGLILLDLMMPVLNGYDFHRILQERYPDTLARIPLVVATAAGSPTNIPMLPLSVERIRKPLDLDELFAVIEKYCGKPA